MPCLHQADLNILQNGMAERFRVGMGINDQNFRQIILIVVGLWGAPAGLSQVNEIK
jgi:hypothetical protein